MVAAVKPPFFGRKADEFEGVIEGQAGLDEGIMKIRPSGLTGRSRDVAGVKILEITDQRGQPGFGNLGGKRGDGRIIGRLSRISKGAADSSRRRAPSPLIKASQDSPRSLTGRISAFVSGESVAEAIFSIRTSKVSGAAEDPAVSDRARTIQVRRRRLFDQGFPFTFMF
jgi:hypothetical protein